MKRLYMTIAILAAALLASNIWHSAVRAQTRVDRFQGSVVVKGTTLSVLNATNPAVVVADSTNSVTLKVLSQDSQGFIGTSTNHDLRIMTNNAAEMTILAAGNVGIGTTSPAGALHLVGTGGLFIHGTSEADDTRKIAWLATEHYDVDEEPFIYAAPDANTATNHLRIGGGTVDGNAATSISFYTAADSITTTGTEVARIDTSGYFYFTDRIVDIGDTNTYIASPGTDEFSITTGGQLRFAIGTDSLINASGANGIDFYTNDHFIQMSEMSAPNAPVGNAATIYVVDNGGKTELCVRFNTGGACIRIAIEP